MKAGHLLLALALALVLHAGFSAVHCA